MRHLEQMKDMKENNRITSEDSKATKLEKQTRMLRNMINLRLDLLNEDWGRYPGNLLHEIAKRYRVTGGSMQCRRILKRMAHKNVESDRPTGWRVSAIERLKEEKEFFLLGGSHGPSLTVPIKVDENNKVSVDRVALGFMGLE